MLSEVKLRISMTLVLFVASSVGVGSAQVTRNFHRAFAVSMVKPVNLKIDLLEGDLRIAYARDGQVSISVAAENASDMDLESLSTRLMMAQTGNHLELGERPDPGAQNLKVTFTIDVPYRTEVHTSLQRGKQTITGIMGPVNAESGIGNIEVSYVSLGVTATARTGNLNFEAVGDRIEARTGHGNVICQRAPQGISAETEDGDISIALIGASTAAVKRGNGRIEVGGARGVLFASTSTGDLHVKAVPREDWQLSSESGTIRVELPPKVDFELDAATTSGQLMIRRDDLVEPSAGLRHLAQKANAGGKRIEVRTNTGNVVIE
jgi:hypothetical protein